MRGINIVLRSLEDALVFLLGAVYDVWHAKDKFFNIYSYMMFYTLSGAWNDN